MSVGMLSPQPPKGSFNFSTPSLLQVWLGSWAKRTRANARPGVSPWLVLPMFLNSVVEADSVWFHAMSSLTLYAGFELFWILF